MGRCAHHPSYHEALQGRDQQGAFRTSRCKIYPEEMNRAIANSVEHYIREVYEDVDRVETADQLPSPFEPFLNGQMVDKGFVQRDYHGPQPA